MAGKNAAQGGYESFEHTSDLGLKVRGKNLVDLFEQAAAGFIELMIDPRTVRPARLLEVRTSGEEPEELLVAWLQEILFAFEAEGFAPASAQCPTNGRNHLSFLALNPAVNVPGVTFSGVR
jgi:SHS2 domain-containing protein